MANGNKRKRTGLIALLLGILVSVAAGYFIKADDGRTMLDSWFDKITTVAVENGIKLPASLTGIEEPKTVLKEDQTVTEKSVSEKTALLKEPENSKSENWKLNLETKDEGNEVKAPVTPKVEEKLDNKEAKAEEVEEPITKPLVNSVPKVKIEFNVLRVEKDGSTLIAGNGPSEAKIEVIEGEIVHAESKASSIGDFVALLDKPLAPGQHELFIRATPKNGEAYISSESAVIFLPEFSKDPKSNELMAMINKPGEASQIVQAGEPKKTDAKPVRKETVKTDDVETPVQVKEDQIETATTNEAAVASEQTENTISTLKPSDQSAGSKKEEITIAAIDVEEKQYFIAGKGSVGRKVQIYVNNDFKGVSEVGKEGAFLFNKKDRIKPGKHAVRVDMLDKNQKVLARANVVLEHDVNAIIIGEEKLPPKPVPPTAPKAETVIAALSDNKANEVVIKETQKVEVEETSDTANAKQEYLSERVSDIQQMKDELVPVLKSGQSVIIRKGDNLWKISKRMLGEGRRYTTIYSANETQISDPHLIFPGQVFDVPDADGNASGG